MKAFTQMKEQLLEISRERRSPTKLSDWTEPVEGTEEDKEKKKENQRRRGWTDRRMTDGWIVDGVMGGWCRLVFG